MKATYSVLRALVREGIEGDRIIKERPWAVEHTFTLSGGIATDSEGLAPDGFVIILRGESGGEVRVVVDTYWNPQSGDQSGNELRVEFDGEVIASTYVPQRFDDGKKQKLLISNAPVQGMIIVSHASHDDELPIAYLAVKNPFEVDEDIDFVAENLGNGKADVELTRHVNI